MKNTVKIGLAVGVLSVVSIGGNFAYEKRQYDLSPPSEKLNKPEGMVSLKDTIAGTWLINDSICKGLANPLSFEEYNFGESLKDGVINPVSYSKHKIEIEPTNVADESYNQIENWFTKCEALTLPNYVPVVINQDNFDYQRTFYYYHDINLMLMVAGSNISPLMPISRVKELEIDKAVFNL